AQLSSKTPESNQVKSSVVRLAPCSPTSTKTATDSSAAMISAPQVTACAPRSPSTRPNSPARIAPTSGRKTIRTSIAAASTLHHVDVFDRDRAAVAEKHHEDGQADRRLRGGDGQDEHGEDLADQVVEEAREGDQVDVDSQQDQLDRHQDDDDVAPVQEDAEDAEREEDGADGQVVAESDLQHHTPLPLATSLTSMVSPRRRPICSEMTW